MTPEQLAGIKQSIINYWESKDGGVVDGANYVLINSVPDLLAEVERLTVENARLKARPTEHRCLTCGNTLLFSQRHLCADCASADPERSRWAQGQRPLTENARLREALEASRPLIDALEIFVEREARSGPLLREVLRRIDDFVLVAGTVLTDLDHAGG